MLAVQQWLLLLGWFYHRHTVHDAVSYCTGFWEAILLLVVTRFFVRRDTTVVLVHLHPPRAVLVLTALRRVRPLKPQAAQTAPLVTTVRRAPLDRSQRRICALLATTARAATALARLVLAVPITRTRARPHPPIVFSVPRAAIVPLVQPAPITCVRPVTSVWPVRVLVQPTRALLAITVPISAA